MIANFHPSFRYPILHPYLWKYGTMHFEINTENHFNHPYIFKVYNKIRSRQRNHHTNL
jgi:hypothetical protein